MPLDSAPARIVVIGHVDHGKSTLLGRILLDCGRVPKEREERMRAVCQQKGLEFEPAFFFDALKEEQDQGISIDTTRVNLEFGGRRFLMIDAPGHLDFLKNMTGGAADAELGLLVLDCLEGVRAQTERHLRVLNLLGVRDLVVAVNKLDRAGYDRGTFERLSETAAALAENEGLDLKAVVPVAARTGENVSCASARMPWYEGKPLLGLLCDITGATIDCRPEKEPFRMPLQDVYKFGDRRYFAGRVTSGEIVSGQEVLFLPSGKLTRIESIARYPSLNLERAARGDSIAVCLTEQVFVERGEVMVLPDSAPEVETRFGARIVWFGPEPLDEGRDYILKIGCDEAKCRLRLAALPAPAAQVVAGELVSLTITAAKPVAIDKLPGQTGINTFVICSAYETLAAGTVDRQASEQSACPAGNGTAETGYLTRQRHEKANQHQGTVLWLTGLSGAGKSALAKSVERRLFDCGMRIVVLDGDNVRAGLCADLGFSPEDRSENIRRLAHVARLFLDTGFIVIAACISPYARDRELARAIIGRDDFNEVFVFCPLEICRQRDPKGLYKKGSDGALKEMTGLDAPYQTPVNPSLRLDSSSMSLEAETAAVMDLLQVRGVLAPGAACPASVASAG